MGLGATNLRNRVSIWSCTLPTCKSRAPGTCRDAGIDEVRPSEQIDEAVAGGKVDRVCQSASVMLVGSISVTACTFLLPSEFGDRARPPGARVKPSRLESLSAYVSPHFSTAERPLP